VTGVATRLPDLVSPGRYASSINNVATFAVFADEANRLGTKRQGTIDVEGFVARSVENRSWIVAHPPSTPCRFAEERLYHPDGVDRDAR